MKIKYGCYIPKIDLANNEVFHKELIIFALDGEEIIGAEQFDYNGNSRPIDHTELKYVKHHTYEHTNITKAGATILSATTSVLKQALMFNTKTEAYLQKLELLSQIRIMFIDDIRDRETHFNSKIPRNIKEIRDRNYSQHPEVFL